jgi:hypothetical protein
METHGVPIEVDWSRFEVGSSFFVPAVAAQPLLNQIRQKMREVGVTVVIRRRVENNLLGFRVWRTN